MFFIIHQLENTILKLILMISFLRVNIINLELETLIVNILGVGLLHCI